jgi:hypothetical protein
LRVEDKRRRACCELREKQKDGVGQGLDGQAECIIPSGRLRRHKLISDRAGHRTLRPFVSAEAYRASIVNRSPIPFSGAANVKQAMK